MFCRFDIKRSAIFRRLAAALACALVLSACRTQGASSQDASRDEPATQAQNAALTAKLSVVYDENDENTQWDSQTATAILLEGDGVSVQGAGASADGSVVTVTEAGTYVVSGTLNDGQIVVNADQKLVHLVLNGADITCSDNAPIDVKAAEKVILTLAQGSENRVADGESDALRDASSDGPDAAVFSKSDLTVNGEGSLQVTAGYNRGIVSKDGLKLVGGVISVTSAGDGIRGRDFIAVKGGDITVVAQEDGMQSNHDEDAQKGFVLIENATLSITAAQDGIQAETNLVVLDATLSVTAGGGAAAVSTQADGRGGLGGPQMGGMRGPGGAGGRQPESGAPKTQNAAGESEAADLPSWGPPEGMGGAQEAQGASDENSVSAKGLKAGAGIVISGGSLAVDSADDAVHSNGSVAVSGGTLKLSSGDDGIHADAELLLTGGEIAIERSYEGIEGAAITVGDVKLSIVADDDGINVAGGNDSASFGGRRTQDSFSDMGGRMLTITGGVITVEADGDGIDSNGSIQMSGGLVLVNGPTSDANGAVDYDGSFILTGGTIAAAGSAGMAQAASADSTQNSVLITFDAAQQAGSVVCIRTASGEELVTFAPAKQYRSLFFSSDQLKTGETYEIYCGAKAVGDAANGLYTGSSCTGGTLFESFTVKETATRVGVTVGAGDRTAGFKADGQRGGGPAGAGQRPRTQGAEQTASQQSA